MMFAIINARLRPLVILTLLGLLPGAYALTLTQALEYVTSRSSVVNAQTELQDAKANLTRIARDPLAVRADSLQAEQRLALAKASLEQTRYAAVSELTSAYTGVLGAQAQSALAQQSLELSRRSLRVARIRLENGSATRLDLSDAQAALNEAQNNLRAATQAQTLALDNLVSILGREVKASELGELPESALPELPPLQAALRSSERHPTLLGAAQQAALAELNTEVLDPLYAAQAQIDTAQSQRASAESALAEAQRSFPLQVRNLYTQAENARASLRLATSALQNAQARLQTQKLRLSGGLISQIEFGQAQLTAAQADLAAKNARYTYLNALLELQAGSLVPLGQPFSTRTSKTAGRIA